MYSKEASSGYVDLDDDDPLVVDALLMYLYTGDYSDVVLESDLRSSTVFNVQVFALAEKFFVKPLQHAASYKFNAIANSYDEEKFGDAIEEWARSTMDVDKILGNMILNIIIDNRTSIFKPGQAFARVKELIGQIPWLAAQTAQMFSLYMDIHKSKGIYRCPNGKCKQCFMADMVPGKQFHVSCLNCGKEARMNATNWERHRVSFRVLGPADEGEEKVEVKE